MNKKISLLIFLCLLLSTYNLKCQVNNLSPNGPDTTSWSVGIFYDQDHSLELLGFDKLNEDRNYTLGFGIYFQSTGLNNCFLFAPNKWLNHLFNNREKFTSGQSITQKPFYSFMLAGSGFTPDSLPASTVIFNDRPYASIIMLQTSINNPAYQRYKNYRSNFTMAWLGSILPGNIQTAIHKAMNNNDTKPPRTPRGWNNQISDGGEPTFAYSYTKEMLITRKHLNSVTPEKSKGTELKHGFKYSLGYHTYLGYDISLRIGWFDANNWNYDTSPLSGVNKNIRKTTYHKPFEFYMVSSVRPVFMLYNAMLNGQFKKSVHTVNFNYTRHLMFEFDSGIGLAFALNSNSGIDIKLKGSGRSPEFKLSGRDARFHYWAGLDIVFSHF